MKRTALLILTTSLLVGCSVPNFPLGGGSQTGGVNNLPVEALNGIEFKPISAENAKYLNSGNLVSAGAGNVVSAGGGNAPTAAAAPVANTSGAVVAGDAMGAPAAKAAPAPAPNGGGGAVSGNVYGYYGYGYYFGGYGGNTDPMALVSITQAETQGSKGSFQEVLKSVVAPVVKAWAKDGRLTASNATLNNDGSPWVDPNQTSSKGISPDAIYGGGWGQAGWHLSYTSSSRNEVLNFTVAPDKTTIIRMRWAPLNLSPDNVSVDSSAAVKKLIAAIKDKSFKSEEEKSGNDYFLGFPYDKTNTGYYGGSRTEVVYDVPQDARWNVTLQPILGKLVWQLNYYASNNGYPVYGPIASVAAGTAVAEPAVAEPAVAESAPRAVAQVTDPGYWFNNSAQGMVDAQTGAVIRFTRPIKTYYNEPTPMTTPIPMPKSSPSPLPAVTTPPSPAPSATATTTPAPQQ